MNLISGTAIASQVLSSLKCAIAPLEKRKPGLAFVLVGNNPSSQTYVRMKKKRCKEVGIVSYDFEFPETISEEQLLREIHTLNLNDNVDGILIQLPLPKQIRTSLVMCAIDPTKDVDGFHPLNVGKLLLGETDGFVPCTPLGIHTLLTHSNIPLQGKHVVILGRSNIVGKPLGALLMQKNRDCNATVTIAHSRSDHLAEICQSADILVAAIGQPQFVGPSLVKQGAVVIDVGINKIEHSPTSAKIVGDVNFDQVAPLTSAITPVPGGVGPMTIAMLLSNTLLSYQRRTYRK